MEFFVIDSRFLSFCTKHLYLVPILCYFSVTEHITLDTAAFKSLKSRTRTVRF